MAEGVAGGRQPFLEFCVYYAKAFVLIVRITIRKGWSGEGEECTIYAVADLDASHFSFGLG